MSNTISPPDQHNVHSNMVADALQQAHDSYVTPGARVTPVDSVEDMLVLSENIQVATNYLAQKHHELQPEDPADLAPEHHERIVSHAKFLKEVGRISAEDWDRVGLGDEGPDEVVTTHLAETLKSQDPKYLSSLTRPNWQEHFPTAGDEESAKKWDEFKAQYPEDMQVMLESLFTSHSLLSSLQESPELEHAFAEHKDKRFDVLMAASCVRSLERTAEQFRERAIHLRRAIPEGIPGKQILAQADELDAQADHFTARAGQFLLTGKTVTKDGKEVPELNQKVVDELARRKRLDDRREIRHGLLLTDEMKKLTETFVPQLLGGKPVLLVGETGGAKTAAAEYMAQEVNRQLGKDPKAYEFVSGYDDVNSYQLMSRLGLKVQDGMPSDTEIEALTQKILGDEQQGQQLTPEITAAARLKAVDILFDKKVVTVSEDGPLARAIRHGMPIVIDEGNAIPPGMLKRLNKFLQLRPGDSFTLQEDGGEQVTVQKGFCVIFTANEKSARYSSTYELPADFKNRFAANVGRVSYPDLDVLPGQPPQTLLRLAEATIVNQYGEVPEDNPALDKRTILNFVKACHRLQRMFCIPLENLQDTEKAGLDASIVRNAGGGRTALRMETISPRMMTGILDDLVQGGRSGTQLKDVLERYIEGITEPSDRQVIKTQLNDLL